MSNLEQIQLFGEKQIRTAWNDAEEKWYFSVIDIIAALVETDRPRNYWAEHCPSCRGNVVGDLATR